jgi:hypothetical protein
LSQLLCINQKLVSFLLFNNFNIRSLL